MCFALQAVGGHRGTRLVPTGMTTTLKPCWAIATSGVHVREQLFNGTVCRHSPFQAYSHFDFSGEIDRRLNPEMGDFVEVLAPIILPHPDGKRHRKGSHGDIIFLNSRGEVGSPLNHLLFCGVLVESLRSIMTFDRIALYLQFYNFTIDPSYGILFKIKSTSKKYLVILH